MDTCSECGAHSATPCAELFHRLLALDHSRQEPWGPLHGAAVACYLLQHPSLLPQGGHVVPLELLRTHVEDGAAAARRLTERSRRANSHRVRGRERSAPDSLPEAPAGFTFTIAGASEDGGFPAEGHPERVRAWAESTLAAWRN
ncbi:DUF5946 family protein [Nocardiopsis oceani]